MCLGHARDQGVNEHLHLRDGAMLQAVLPESARHFARALIMPNLVPPVVTAAQAAAYRDRIQAALPEGATFLPMMTLYLTETTDPADVAAYDGVWASACLLHCPRDAFADVLARIHAALKPGGALYASFKAGTAANGNTGGLDNLGRYYNYPDEGWLVSMFAGTGQPREPAWARVEIDKVGGLDGETDWLHVLARKG